MQFTIPRIFNFQTTSNLWQKFQTNSIVEKTMLHYGHQLLMCTTSVDKCRQVSTSVNKCQQVSASVDKCQHMLTHVNKCQKVSTSVNTCQHMSTSVNKCQQVSTSVDKCQQVSTSVLLKVYACLTYSQASGLVMSTVKNFSKFMSVLEYRTLRHSLTAARHS